MEYLKVTQMEDLGVTAVLYEIKYMYKPENLLISVIIKYIIASHVEVSPQFELFVSQIHKL